MLDITTAIRSATSRIIARRFILENERMTMDRLSEKLAKAAGVVQRQTSRIEAKADALIAREAEMEARTDRSFDPHNAMLDDATKGLDGLDRKLALVSNDPLESSGGSPAVETADAATFPDK